MRRGVAALTLLTEISISVMAVGTWGGAGYQQEVGVVREPPTTSLLSACSSLWVAATCLPA